MLDNLAYCAFAVVLAVFVAFFLFMLAGFMARLMVEVKVWQEFKLLETCYRLSGELAVCVLNTGYGFSVLETIS